MPIDKSRQLVTLPCPCFQSDLAVTPNPGIMSSMWRKRLGQAVMGSTEFLTATWAQPPPVGLSLLQQPVFEVELPTTCPQ